ncbi:AcrR family transcriptional regulator [Paenibacillus rhizosphaerae]|uniref:AcrR family transcriptional regulator n=1 Tax=Paenibacillus rhizosphaerae TaxID=297318 RepID=A0A839TNJ8_9BACL|nr:TetR/AcrR family transcriptional regulator [Paenibacillus rhizosphaerae]MBB3128103.1 AcrR family transcriptional regulator [Paenibacillus rhizosphaerae]
MNKRVTYTQHYLSEALISLMAEKDYASITIRNIVEKAGVNRSTFYLHYYDKDDLLNQTASGILTALRSAMRNPSYSHESARKDYEESGKPISSAVTLFEHIRQHAAFYTIMMNVKDFPVQLDQVIKSELLAFTTDALQASFSSGGMMGLIYYWLNHQMQETAEEMALWLTRAALYPLNRPEV